MVDSIDRLILIRGMIRPSPRELYNKIRAARDAAAENRVALLNQSVMACDAIDLDYIIDPDLLMLLPDLLSDVNPSDYAGVYPPQRSYEPEIAGLALFAFELQTSRFNRPIYIKFAYTDETLWVVSFHPNRPETK